MGVNHTYAEAIKLLGDSVTVRPEGYATDKKYKTIHILPEGKLIRRYISVRERPTYVSTFS